MLRILNKIDLSIKLKESNSTHQYYTHIMPLVNTLRVEDMLLSKRRIVHALTYEGILLIIIAVALSVIFKMPLEVTGILGIVMAVTSMLWNMVFNHFFEKFEAKHQLKRTVKVRILHAVGFEGGLMLATIPMVAYVLNIGIWQAIVLDFSMTLCILVYTFIFQWCYDHLEARLGYSPVYRH